MICGNRRILARRSASSGPQAAGHRFEAKRKAYLSPRTVAFNVHGVRLAVHRVTGEIRILHSVHAADIGRLINPMQCRGQIDGAVAMGFGWALTENMAYDEAGTYGQSGTKELSHPGFRRCAAQRSVLCRHRTMRSDRWVLSPRASARSTRLRRRSRTRSPMRPAFGSATCLSLRIGSSTSSAGRHEPVATERSRLGDHRYPDEG